MLAMQPDDPSITAIKGLHSLRGAAPIAAGSKAVRPSQQILVTSTLMTALNQPARQRLRDDKPCGGNWEHLRRTGHRGIVEAIEVIARAATI